MREKKTISTFLFQVIWTFDL